MAGSHTVNLSDTIAQWVTKSNAQDSDIGIRANLTTSTKTSLVHAINSVQSGLLDSANVITLINANATLDSSATLSLVKSSLGITGGKFSDTATINYDSAGPRMSIQGSSITSSLFNSPVTLIIYDSSGSALKTLRSPGS
tara:strand:- start:80 stop:499 length:420 start_codon:yes stop_codon:yes gene_type:complete